MCCFCLNRYISLKNKKTKIKNIGFYVLRKRKIEHFQVFELITIKLRSRVVVNYIAFFWYKFGTSLNNSAHTKFQVQLMKELM
jgi:hypothetical protein